MAFNIHDSFRLNNIYPERLAILPSDIPELRSPPDMIGNCTYVLCTPDQRRELLHIYPSSEPEMLHYNAPLLRQLIATRGRVFESLKHEVQFLRLHHGLSFLRSAALVCDACDGDVSA